MGAIAAVNSCGDVVAEDGRFIAGLVEMDDEFGGFGPPTSTLTPEPVYPKLGHGVQMEKMNTTLAVVACDAALSHEDTCRLAVMARAGFAVDGDEDEGIRRQHGAYPLQRIGTVEQTAAATLFLLSDEAGFINGAALPMEGGATVGKW